MRPKARRRAELISHVKQTFKTHDNAGLEDPRACVCKRARMWCALCARMRVHMLCVTKPNYVYTTICDMRAKEECACRYSCVNVIFNIRKL